MRVLIQGKDLIGLLTDFKLKLVRTYKGDIERTQTGTIATFPTSFITPGFDMSFTGTVDEIRQLEQIALSDNVVDLKVDYNGINISGKFSCTSNDLTIMKDKNERHAQLSLSFVSDGTAIKDFNGANFAVTYGATTVMSNLSFGNTYAVPVTYRGKKLNGYTVGNKILILGNHVLTD